MGANLACEQKQMQMPLLGIARLACEHEQMPMPLLAVHLLLALM